MFLHWIHRQKVVTMEASSAPAPEIWLCTMLMPLLEKWPQWPGPTLSRGRPNTGGPKPWPRRGLSSQHHCPWTSCPPCGWGPCDPFPMLNSHPWCFRNMGGFSFCWFLFLSKTKRYRLKGGGSLGSSGGFLWVFFWHRKSPRFFPLRFWHKPWRTFSPTATLVHQLTSKQLKEEYKEHKDFQSYATVIKYQKRFETTLVAPSRSKPLQIRKHFSSNVQKLAAPLPEFM